MSDVLHSSSPRGAMNSLMAEIIEDHIRVQSVDPTGTAAPAPAAPKS